MRSTWGLAVVVLLLLAAARPASAFEEMQGARALGMGGALRGAAAGSSGVFLNPAGMSLLRSYVVEAAYQFRPQDSLNIVGVNITDSATSKAGVAAGLYYNFMNAEPSVNGLTFTRRGHEAGVAVSYPLAERLILGVTNKYYYLDTTAGPVNLAGARARGYTLDLGAVLRATDSVSLSVVGQNLVDMKSWETPPTLGFGLAFAFAQSIVLDFDGVIRWLGYPGRETKAAASYHVGGEYFLGQRFPLRLGYSYDYTYRSLTAMTDPAVSPAADSFFHAGLGYVTPQFGIEAGYRQQVSGDDRESLFAFALKLFVQ